MSTSDNQNTPADGMPVVAPSNPVRTTGPLDTMKSWFTGPGKQKPASTSTHKPGSSLSRIRDSIEEFDEDYRNMGERIMGAFQLFAGYIVPFVIVAAVGNDIGGYFAPSWGAFSSYAISYGMECVIAALTIAMGRAFEHISTGNAQWGKVVMTVAGWLLLNASSAFCMYLLTIGSKSIDHSQVALIGQFVRVVAVALIDFGCSLALMWRGKSIQKHIEAIHRKAAAISSLADAERSMVEADKNAALREQMMQATLKIQEDLSRNIGQAVSMVMESILEKMEKALKDDGKGRNEGRFGTR